jgi:hypothetical protein
VRRLHLRPAFVLTFSAAASGSLGCAKDIPIDEGHNPPAQDFPGPPTSDRTSVSPVPSAPITSATGVEPHPAQEVSLNPLSQGSAVRLASNGTCFVYLPFGPLKPGEQRPPGTEPPRAAVSCPAGFAADSAYRDCIEGVVLAKAASDCVCAIGGNPPPLPRPVNCPK